MWGFYRVRLPADQREQAGVKRFSGSLVWRLAISGAYAPAGIQDRLGGNKTYNYNKTLHLTLANSIDVTTTKQGPLRGPSLGPLVLAADS